MASNSQSGPISVSAPGSSLVNATGTNVTFNTRYPFAKIDSTLTNSFQILTFFFNNDTPTPDGTISIYNRTQIYQFAHGYSYVPATWFLVSLNNFQSSLGPEGVLIVNGASNNPATSCAVLVVIVDSTNVTFYVDKYYNNSGPPAPSVLGLFVSVRSYVFANDLSGTDVPSQA